MLTIKNKYKIYFFLLTAIFCIYFLFSASFLDSIRIKSSATPSLINPQLLNIDTLDLYLESSGSSVYNFYFGPHDMQYIGNKLYLAVGGCKPAECGGGLLVEYNVDTEIARAITSVNKIGEIYNPITEESLHDLDEYNGKLYIAGTDPSVADDWSLGNVYTYSDIEGITKFRTIPNAVHTWGQKIINNKWYITTGSVQPDLVTTYSDIFVSDDEGSTWTSLSQPNDYRVYDIAESGGNFFITANTGGVTTLMRNASSDLSTWIPINTSIEPSASHRLIETENGILYLSKINVNTLVEVTNDTFDVKVHHLPLSTSFETNLYYNKLAIDESGYLYALSSDRTVIRTKNYIDWYTVASIPSSSSLDSLAYDSTRNVLAVSSIGGTSNVWELDLDDIVELPFLGKDPDYTGIEGTVYRDSNANFVFDSGESGLEGVMIELWQGKRYLDRTYTDAEGQYHFDYLPLGGDYQLIQTQPLTFNSTEIENNMYRFEVKTGTFLENVNFGESPYANISGRVYQDNNNSGIVGVLVKLYKNSVQVDHAYTDENGVYSFGPYQVGNYQVLETQPIKYFEGVVNPSNSVIVNHQLLPSDVNFSESLGVIYGMTYLDADSNSNYDNLDGLLAGIKIDIFNSKKDLVASYTTSSDGIYRFEDLFRDEYSIVKSYNSGYLPTQNPSNENTVDLINYSSYKLYFGFNVNGVPSLSGFVYIDKNDDGYKQSNESGIARVQILLEGIYTIGHSGPIKIYKAETYTDLDGYYFFDNLPKNGVYNIREIQPKYLDGKDTIGTLGGDTLNDYHYNIQLGYLSGENYLFGERTKTISGLVYEERTNRSISNVKLSLESKSTNQILGVTTTNNDGYYEFDTMPAGDYIIRQTQPIGYLNGSVNPTNMIEVNYELVELDSLNFSEIKELATTGKSSNWIRYIHIFEKK